MSLFLHPTTLLCLWGVFVFSLSLLSIQLQLLFVLISFGILFYFKQSPLKSIKQSRYFLGMIFLVNILTSSGDWQISLYSGLIQSIRFLNMAISIHILLLLLTKEMLLMGLYYLFYPLRFLQIHSDILVMRLWLTLQYFEKFIAEKQQYSVSDWHLLLQYFIQKESAQKCEIYLPSKKFHFLDKFIFLIIISFIIFYITYKII